MDKQHQLKLTWPSRKRSPVVVEKQQRTQFRNSLQVILPKDPSSAASDDLDSPNDACLEPDLSVECGPESPSMCFESLWDQPEIDYPAERLIQGAAENCAKEPGIFEMVLNQRKDSDFTIISENSRVHQTEPKPASSSDAKLSGQSHIIYSYYSFLDLDISGLLPDDINYLEAQGCFRVPTPEALDEFVQEYFLHVHPALPLLDEAWFWAIFTRPVRGRSNLSLFVFQAMLFTACSVCYELCVYLDIGFADFVVPTLFNPPKSWICFSTQCTRHILPSQ